MHARMRMHARGHIAVRGRGTDSMNGAAISRGGARAAEARVAVRTATETAAEARVVAQ